MIPPPTPTPTPLLTSPSPINTISPPPPGTILRNWVNQLRHTINNTLQQGPKQMKKTSQNQWKMFIASMNKWLISLCNRFVRRNDTNNNNNNNDILRQFAKDVLTLQTASRHASMQVRYLYSLHLTNTYPLNRSSQYISPSYPPLCCLKCIFLRTSNISCYLSVEYQIVKT